MSRNADSARGLIAALMRTRSATLVDVDRHAGDAERLLVLSNISGTPQLVELIDGELGYLTGLPESVRAAAYVPGHRQAVVAVDHGGNERDQLYLLDLAAAWHDPVHSFDALDPLCVDPLWPHRPAGISPDGRLLAYLSTEANGIDFDLWILDLQTRERRLLWASGGLAFAAGGFSPDGRLIGVALSGEQPLDMRLLLIDVDSASAHEPIPHPGDSALFSDPAWLDAGRFVVASNAGRDRSALLLHDLGTGRTELLHSVADAEVEAVSAAADGTLALTLNRDCATPITVLRDGIELPLPWAGPGVCASHAIAPPILSADGRRLYYTLTTPRANADVYRYDIATRAGVRLTHSPTDVDVERLSGAELHTVSSFDGEPIQLFLHRPDSFRRADGSIERPPVVVLVHGGPASQSLLNFDPIKQALVAAGYGVVVPNVRGSTGYGKRFAALDDTVKRLDSVADLAAVHGALAELGFDSDRAVLWGGSYGGYMVLAGLAFQPELWAAGVDIVGISNFVTFLTNTSAYRRANREAEYGSLEHDLEFLVRASPLTHVDRIRAPLFVIHGANDPRVPVTEAQQLERSLRERGVPCELLIYDNEGHGLARLENRLDAYPRAIEFLDKSLGR